MIRISLNGEMISLGTSGLAVVPEKWDNKSGRMKSKTAEKYIQNERERERERERQENISDLKYKIKSNRRQEKIPEKKSRSPFC